MWKSDFPVFIACQFWKDFGIFVIIRSIALWVFGVLITVLSPMVFLQLQIMQKSFMGCSVGSTLKPTKSSILTQFEEKTSMVLLLWYLVFSWILFPLFFLRFSSTTKPSIDTFELSNEMKMVYLLLYKEASRHHLYSVSSV